MSELQQVCGAPLSALLHQPSLHRVVLKCSVPMRDVMQWLAKQFPSLNNKAPLQQVAASPPSHLQSIKLKETPSVVMLKRLQAFKLASLASPSKLVEVLQGNRKMNVVTSLKRHQFKNLLLSIV